jgi:hypothetical protein
VHVTWYGTTVTTPELSQISGRVSLETELRNDGTTPVRLTLRTEIVDPAGKTEAELPATNGSVGAGGTVTLRQVSAPITHSSL